MKPIQLLKCAVPGIIVRQANLPIVVRVVDDEGKAVDYCLNPAGKNKLGACLGKVPPPIQNQLSQQ